MQRLEVNLSCPSSAALDLVLVTGASTGLELTDWADWPVGAACLHFFNAGITKITYGLCKVFYVYGCFAYMHVCAPHVWKPAEARKELELQKL